MIGVTSRLLRLGTENVSQSRKKRQQKIGGENDNMKKQKVFERKFKRRTTQQSSKSELYFALNSAHMCSLYFSTEYCKGETTHIIR